MTARAGSAAPAGLTAAQVAAARAQFGRNELAVPRAPTPWQRLLGLLREPMTLLLLAAADAARRLPDRRGAS